MMVNKISELLQGRNIMEIRIQLPMNNVSIQNCAQEFYVIEKGWVREWNRKSREEVDEIRKRKLSQHIEKKQKKKQQRRNRSED
jgi:hypothetical protein